MRDSPPTKNSSAPPCTTGDLVLADLVALGQVGIEIVLAREDRERRDRRADGQAEADRPLDGAAVSDRQVPGNARSTAEAWVFGAAPNAVDAPLKIFERVESWAWVSMPITTS